MTYNYKGYMVRTVQSTKDPVRVYPPSCFLNPMYCTTSLDEAMRWIDAYRAGAQWAVNARIPAKVG